MKLFNPKQIKDKEQEKTDLQLIEGMKLTKAVNKKRLELHGLYDDIEKAKKEAESKVGKVKEWAEQRIKEIKGQVKSLEKTRDEILEPVPQILDNARKHEQKSAEMMESLSKEKRLVAEYTKRLDLRERKLNKDREVVAEQLKDVADEKKDLSVRASSLVQREKSFNKAVRDTENSLKKRSEEVAKQERGLKEREAKIKAKQEFLRDKQEILEEKDKKLTAKEERLARHHKRLYGR